MQIKDDAIFLCHDLIDCEILHQFSTDVYLYIEVWQGYIVICNNETIFVYFEK